MIKRILIACAGLLALFGLLGGIKGLQIERMIAQGKQSAPPPETVTTATAAVQSWERVLTATGSLSAVQGVTVTAELGGKITRIAFTPGSFVRAGELLVQQDTSTEEAQLRAAEAAVALAQLNRARLAKLLAERTIAPSQFDNAEAAYKQAAAQADAIRAAIAKKTIRAPFAGRLGVRLVNLGQFVGEGAPIVALQSLDPIYVDFALPQQHLPRLQTGLPVKVTTDALPPGEAVAGRLTTVDPLVDAATRNVRLQATVANPREALRPGMFVNVAVVLPGRERVIAVPATAVLYAPYSDSVFVLEELPGAGDGAPAHRVRQTIVQLGERRGDFVAVLAGLREGDAVVSTGVFKLRNGQAVVVDNRLAPEFRLEPKPNND